MKNSTILKTIILLTFVLLATLNSNDPKKFYVDESYTTHLTARITHQFLSDCCMLQTAISHETARALKVMPKYE